MNQRKMVWIGATISMIGSILVFMGNGCSGAFVPKDLSDNSTNTSNSASSEDDDFIPGAKTASVVYANQVLEHLTGCAGVTTPSTGTLSVYENKKGAISVTGAANTVTSPMMMAITSIAGEVCNDLINQESGATKRIFKNFDMTASRLPADADMKDAVTRLALSCWQRQDDNTERQVLLDSIYNSVGATEAMASRKSALMACTSVLSSLDALKN